MRIKSFNLNIKYNVKNSLLSGQYWIVLASIWSLISINLIYAIEWHDPVSKIIGSLEIFVFVANTIIITMVFNSETTLSYLIYVFIYMMFLTVAVLVSKDLSLVHVFGSDENKVTNIGYIMKMISNLLIFGFIITNGIILPIILLFVTLSFIEAKIIRKLNKQWTRMTFWISFQLFIIVFMYFLLNNVSDLESTFSKDLWESLLMNKMKLSKEWANGPGQRIYDISIKALLIIWFPMLIKVNNFRGTDMFLSFAAIIVFPTILNFIESDATLMKEMNYMLAVPLFFMVLSLLWVVYYLYLFFKTTKLNLEESKKEKFIPYIVHRLDKRDPIAELVYERHEENRLE